MKNNHYGPVASSRGPVTDLIELWISAKLSRRASANDADREAPEDVTADKEGEQS